MLLFDSLPFGSISHMCPFGGGGGGGFIAIVFRLALPLCSDLYVLVV